MRIKNKIILFIMVLFMMMILTPKVQAYTTPNYFAQNMVWWLPMNDDGNLRTAITENLGAEGGHFRIEKSSQGSEVFKHIVPLSPYTPSTSTIIADVGKELTKLGWKWDSKRDWYQTNWYGMDNATEGGTGDQGMNFCGPIYRVGRIEGKNYPDKQVMGIQWTSNGNKMYMARINMFFQGAGSFVCNVTVITNDNVNKKIQDEIAKEKENIMTNINNRLENDHENGELGADASADDIFYWVYSDVSKNGGKKMNALASTDDGLEKIKKWKETIEKATTLEVYKLNEYTGENKDYKGELLKNLQDLINAEKDQNKINNALNDATQNAQTIQMIVLKTYSSIISDGRGNVIFFGDDDDVLQNIGAYDPGSTSLDPDTTTKIEEIAGTILKTITNIGIIVSLLMIAVLGVKYMIGSVEEKAEYKKDLVPYVIGAFILFGGSTIIKILLAIGESINAI